MLTEIAPGVFLQPHPLTLAGCRIGRTVTIIRLLSGKTVIHSTADFRPEHLAEISKIGEPGWLVDATNFHDTSAKAGRTAFSHLPYLVPPGFSGAESLNSTSLAPPPPEWSGELDVIEIGGMPRVREHVFFHHASKTLVVADLLFNLPPEAGRWTRGFMRTVAGIRKYPGMSRMFRFCIKDRAVFMESMRKIATLDFERIVVGHGEPIAEDARARFRAILAHHFPGGIEPRPESTL